MLVKRKSILKDWELEEFRKACDEQMDCYVELKCLTGLRIVEMLSLTMTNIRETGLYIPSGKKRAPAESIVFVWTKELTEVIDRIKKLPRAVDAEHFFILKNGKPFIDRNCNIIGFSSRWRKFMDAAVNETNLQRPFREHEIRWKVLDEKSRMLSDIMGHANSISTQSYIRGR